MKLVWNSSLYFGHIDPLYLLLCIVMKIILIHVIGFSYVIVHGLFNDAVSSSDYVVLSDRMISE
jgi:hypothetical protein